MTHLVKCGSASANVIIFDDVQHTTVQVNTNRVLGGSNSSGVECCFNFNFLPWLLVTTGKNKLHTLRCTNAWRTYWCTNSVMGMEKKHDYNSNFKQWWYDFNFTWCLCGRMNNLACAWPTLVFMLLAYSEFRSHSISHSVEVASRLW